MYDPNPDLIRLHRKINNTDNNYTPLIREIRALRRLQRQTRRKMSKGTIGFRAGVTTLTNLATAISRLQLAQRQLAPQSTDPSTELRRIIDTLLSDLPPTHHP
jgi:hypothetical protein